MPNRHGNLWSVYLLVFVGLVGWSTSRPSTSCQLMGDLLITLTKYPILHTIYTSSALISDHKQMTGLLAAKVNYTLIIFFLIFFYTFNTYLKSKYKLSVITNLLEKIAFFPDLTIRTRSAPFLTPYLSFICFNLPIVILRSCTSLLTLKNICLIII